MEREYKVIAVDFDRTLFETDYPTIIRPIREVIDRAKQERENGAKIILWSCREGEELDAAIQACREEGLEFDAVNDNLPELQEFWRNNPRKVAADEYWDDKSVLCSNVESFDAEETISQLEVLSRTTPLWTAIHLMRDTRNEEGVYAALAAQMRYIPEGLLRVYLWLCGGATCMLETSQKGDAEKRAFEVVRRIGQLIQGELDTRKRNADEH